MAAILVRLTENVQYVHNLAQADVAQWQTADAKNRFAELVGAADGQGPQVVMRHKEVVAVVLSPEDYRRLVRQADANFAHLLSRSPFAEGDLDPVGLSLARRA